MSTEYAMVLIVNLYYICQKF